MLYLFLGQDPLSKDLQFKRIKEEFLPKRLEQFNLDILYARELTLKNLQEKLLNLPLQSPKRIVVIKNTEDLKEEIEDFIFEWSKKPSQATILLLDFSEQAQKEGFIKRIHSYAKVFRFKEKVPLNTFNLIRQIELRRPDYALKVLDQILKDGERPERILGGLRYALEKSSPVSIQARRKVKLLLNCDIEIKTGKLKAPFALEKLVVGLCVLG